MTKGLVGERCQKWYFGFFVNFSFLFYKFDPTAYKASKNTNIKLDVNKQHVM